MNFVSSRKDEAEKIQKKGNTLISLIKELILSEIKLLKEELIIPQFL